MKIKILHILHTLRVGGLENGVVNLINTLDPDRFEHAICCVDASGPMADRIRQHVPIVEMGKGAHRDYLLPVKLSRVIRGIAPDVVHTRNWGTIDGVIGARLAGVRRVIHGEHGREAVDPTGANARRNLFRKLLSPLVTSFVAVSSDLKGWLVETVGVPARKVNCILNGVDTRRFAPPENRHDVRERLGLPMGTFIVGTVGRLDPVKDQATLLSSFAAACGGRGDVLLVVGAGPEAAGLRGLSASLGIAEQVRFLGERKDIPDILQALDVFVLPSIAEGISNTILEAMSCGLPIIASRVGGNEELIDQNGSGVLFPAGDAAALAASLTSYREAPGRGASHGACGRERVIRLFSLERMAGRYTDLYSGVCGGMT